MMATEYTPNYNLDLYASADKPNLRDQYNAAMGKIDTQMKKSADDVTNANANVHTLQTQMTEAQKDISALESTVETHGTQITDVQKTADDALSLAKTNEGNITEAQNDIDGLQTAVDGKAPTNHASATNAYGQGSSANFGHLKVADSGEAGASTGTAASPKLVTDQINALKTAIAPTALIAAKEVTYDGGISGSGTFSVYGNSITKVVSVQLDNTSLSTQGTGGWKQTTLGTIPAGYRPTRLMSQTAFNGWGTLHVFADGTVKLSISDHEARSGGTVNGVGLVYFGAQ
jgi:hypothetical protein